MKSAVSQSVIEIVRTQPLTDVQKRVAYLDQVVIFPAEPCYRHKDTGHLYHFLAGGLAAPRGWTPGYACVLGVVKDPDHDKPLLSVIEETQSRSLRSLIASCIALQEKYGYTIADDLFRPWFGDLDAYSTIVAEYNDKLRQEKGKAWSFIPTVPPITEEVDRIPFYISLLANLLDARDKRLVVGKADILRNALVNIIPEDSLKWTVKKCPPPILALGHVLFAVLQRRPWERTVPTQIHWKSIDSLTLHEALLYGQDYETIQGVIGIPTISGD